MSLAETNPWMPKPAGEVGQVLRVPRNRIRLFVGQPRKIFDQGDLLKLATSILEEGQREPVRVRRVTDDPDHDYELVNGERRWRACELAGVTTMLVWVTEVRGEEDQFEQSTLANIPPKSLTPMETVRAIERIRDSQRLADRPLTERIQKIAVMFEKSPVWVYQQLSLLRLIPEIQAMLEPTTPEERQLNVSLGITLAALPSEKQLEAAEKILSQNMTVGKARLFVQAIGAGKIGRIKEGTIGYHPSDEFRKFWIFIRNLTAGAEFFLELSRRQFMEILSRRSAKELALVTDQLQLAESCLWEIREALEDVRQNLPALDKEDTSEVKLPKRLGGFMPGAKKGRQGFASMDSEKQRKIASRGGITAHQKGTAHVWTSEEARKAGQKGGTVSRGGRGRILSLPDQDTDFSPPEAG